MSVSPPFYTICASTGELYFLVWDVDQQKFYVALSPMYEFQNWGAHICSQALLGDPLSFSGTQKERCPTKPLVTSHKTNYLNQYFVSFVAQNLDAKIEQETKSMDCDFPDISTTAAGMSFEEFLLQLKEKVPLIQYIRSYWSVRYHRAETTKQRYSELVSLCRKVIFFWGVTKNCHKGVVVALWVLCVLALEESCWSCSDQALLQYLSDSLSTALLLPAKKGFLECSAVSLKDLDEHKQLSVVIAMLQKPLRQLPAFQAYANAYFQFFTLWQVGVFQKCPEIDFFYKFASTQLQQFLHLHRSPSEDLSFYCTQLNRIVEKVNKSFLVNKPFIKHWSSALRKNAIFGSSLHTSLSSILEESNQELFRPPCRKANIDLTNTPEYLRCALTFLSARQAQGAPPFTGVWGFQKDFNTLLDERTAYTDTLSRYFPHLIAYSKVNRREGPAIPKTSVKMEKINSQENLREEQERRSSNLFALFSTKTLRKGNLHTSSLSSSLHAPYGTAEENKLSTITFQSDEASIQPKWVIPPTSILRLKLLWLSLCLAFAPDPPLNKIFKGFDFLNSILEVYTRKTKISGAHNGVDVIGLLEDMKTKSFLQKLKTNTLVTQDKNFKISEEDCRHGLDISLQALSLWTRLLEKFLSENIKKITTNGQKNYMDDFFLGLFNKIKGDRNKLKRSNSTTKARNIYSTNMVLEETVSEFQAKEGESHLHVFPFFRALLEENTTKVSTPNFVFKGTKEESGVQLDDTGLKTSKKSLLKQNTSCQQCRSSTSKVEYKSEFRKVKRNPAKSPIKKRQAELTCSLNSSNWPYLQQNSRDSTNSKHPVERERQKELCMTSLFFTLHSQEALGYFFTPSSKRLSTLRMYSEATIKRARRLSWLKFTNDSEEKNFARLPPLHEMVVHDSPQERPDVPIAYVPSISLKLSLLQDAALLLLFLYHNLLKEYKIRLRGVFNFGEASKRTLSPSHCFCHQPAFCVHLFGIQQDPRVFVNFLPWYNTLVVLLARHTGLFQLRIDANDLYYLHILHQAAYVALIEEISFLVEETEGHFDNLKDENWEKIFEVFLKVWTNCQHWTRFYHAKGHNQFSPLHQHLAFCTEHLRISTKRKLEPTRKHIAFWNQALRSTKEEMHLNSSNFVFCSLMNSIQAVATEGGWGQNFKVGLFLNALEAKGETIEIQTIADPKKDQNTSLIKHLISKMVYGTLDQTSMFGCRVQALDYHQLVQNFRAANTFYSAPSTTETEKKAGSFGYFYDLQPWLSGLLFSLIYFEQLACLKNPFLTSSTGSIILEVAMPSETRFHYIIIWTLLAHLVFEETLMKSFGNLPSAILIDPKQDFHFEMVINMLDALMQVPVFAKTHAVHWVTENEKSFSFSPENTHKGAWEYQPVPPKNNKTLRNIFVLSDYRYVQKTSKRNKTKFPSWGRILNLLSLGSSRPDSVHLDCTLLVKVNDLIGTKHNKINGETTIDTESSIIAALANTEIRTRIDLMVEIPLGGFLRPVENNNLPMQNLIQILQNLQQMIYLYDTQREENPLSHVQQENKRRERLGDCHFFNYKKNGQKVSGEEAGLGDEEGKKAEAVLPVEPQCVHPSIGSILPILAYQLENTKVKKQLRLFKSHLWPNQEKPYISRDFLETLFFLLKQLIFPHRLNDQPRPALASRQTALSIKKHHISLYQSPKEVLTWQYALSDILQGGDMTKRSKKVSLEANLRVVIIPKEEDIQELTAVLDKRKILWSGFECCKDSSKFSTTEGSNNFNPKRLRIGSWDSFTKTSAQWIETGSLLSQQPSQLFIDEKYVSKLKSGCPWVFTTPMPNHSSSTIFNVWILRNE